MNFKMKPNYSPTEFKQHPADETETIIKTIDDLNRKIELLEARTDELSEIVAAVIRRHGR